MSGRPSFRRDPLVRRVAILLGARGIDRAVVLSEREALERTKPYGQGVQAAVADPPVLNDARALGSEPSGCARNELVFDEQITV